MDMATLDQSLDCGQCFRWEKQPDGSWQGVVRGRILSIDAGNIGRVLRDPFWAEYFDAELDYGKVRRDLCALDPALERAARFAPEIRILRQEPWEALCSFLISQCNNIKRIKGIISRLCREYGEESGGFYAFPQPEAIAALREDDLRRLGCGYRAGYLIDAAKRVKSGTVDFDELRSLPLGEAREKLQGIEGVGPKVADCSLLYGLHRMDAFPADVWIKRAMRKLFPGKTPAYFGRYAGVAQQYLFHYSRNHPELFEPAGPGAAPDGSACSQHPERLF